MDRKLVLLQLLNVSKLFRMNLRHDRDVLILMWDPHDLDNDNS